MMKNPDKIKSWYIRCVLYKFIRYHFLLVMYKILKLKFCNFRFPLDFLKKYDSVWTET